VKRLRQRLIVGQPITASDVMLLIDRARDGITGEMRQAKARLRSAESGVTMADLSLSGPAWMVVLPIVTGVVVSVR